MQPSKRQKRVVEPANASFVLMLDEPFFPQWPFPLLDDSNAPYTLDHGGLTLDPYAHFRRFGDAAKQWLVPWLSTFALGVAAFRVSNSAGQSLAISDWKPSDVLRTALRKLSPVIQQPLHPFQRPLAFYQTSADFMTRIEQTSRSGLLDPLLTQTLHEFLCAPITPDMQQLVPVYEDQKLVYFENKEKSYEDSKDSENLKLHVITGELELEPQPLMLTIRGAMLANALVDKADCLALFLGSAVGSSLLVVSHKHAPRWIAKLAPASPNLRVILDERGWIRADLRSLRDSVVLTSYEFLLSDNFRAFYTLARDKKQLAHMATVFCRMVQREPNLLAKLTLRQLRLLSTQSFRTDLEDLLRFFHEKKLNDQLDYLAILHAVPAHDDFKHDPVILREFQALFSSRLALVAEPWARLILDNPRDASFYDFKRDGLARFSQEQFGLMRKKMAAGQQWLRSRTLVFFMLSSCPGFRWILSEQPFETVAEARPCLDLLDLRVAGVPWTVYAEQPHGSCLLAPATFKLRRRLLTWASLMSVSHVCALRLEPDPQFPESTLKVALVMSAAETDLHTSSPSLNTLSCLPAIPRMRLGTPDQEKACNVCHAAAQLRTSCRHEYCLACLDKWQQEQLRFRTAVSCPICRQPIENCFLFEYNIAAQSGTKVAAIVDMLSVLDGGTRLVVSQHELLLAECEKHIKAERYDQQQQQQQHVFDNTSERTICMIATDLLQEDLDFAELPLNVHLICAEPLPPAYEKILFAKLMPLGCERKVRCVIFVAEPLVAASS